MFKRLSCLMFFVTMSYCLVAFVSPVQAEVAECSVLDTNDFTVVVICPEGLDQSGWRDAGAKACGLLKPCAAWIWVDPKIAPKTAPSTPTLFSQEQIANAVAIWVNEKQELIMITKSKN
ncbi:MAG: hypothetical protein QM488_19195 [Rhizobiaceae bacterium]